MTLAKFETIERAQVRNFCIIAHIDHGKSTLADRFIELAHAVPRDGLREQLLDSLTLERERGITIKAKAIRLLYPTGGDKVFELNLIDTPGHVDFSHEVVHSLAACEGAILLVDATQGVQAQTVSNVYLALDNQLEIIPVINKIDLPGADIEGAAQELHNHFGFTKDEVLLVSAKTGEGVEALIQEVIRRIPPPPDLTHLPLRARVFDSHYDPYKGVILYVRVVEGSITPNSKLRLKGADRQFEVLETGYFTPEPYPTPGLLSGDVGYVATGEKTLGVIPVGDTITFDEDKVSEPLQTYRPIKPVIFAGIYPTYPEDYELLSQAIGKLHLNDSALTYEPESSPALGHGFRCGFLGSLHMEIVRERLEREFSLSLIATAPAVKLRVVRKDHTVMEITNPLQLPPAHEIDRLEELWVRVKVLTPSPFIGPLMTFITSNEGIYIKTDYLGEGSKSLGQRVSMEFELPLRVMLTTFSDNLKLLSQGYASLDYEPLGYREAHVARLDILVNGTPVDAFSRIVPRSKAYEVGRQLTNRLKEEIPRQLFSVVIQASIDGHIVSRAEIPAKRKDVLAKCYGGDITRKRKLLEKQREGKKRMKMIGRVEIPKEAFTRLFKLEA